MCSQRSFWPHDVGRLAVDLLRRLGVMGQTDTDDVDRKPRCEGCGDDEAPLGADGLCPTCRDLQEPAGG